MKVIRFYTLANDSFRFPRLNPDHRRHERCFDVPCVVLFESQVATTKTTACEGNEAPVERSPLHLLGSRISTCHDEVSARRVVLFPWLTVVQRLFTIL